MKLMIITAEPNNFVPQQLQAEAVKAGHECQIVDIGRTFVVETTDGPKVVWSVKKENSDETQEIELKPPFVCIPRLNEYDLEYKLALLNRLELQGVVMLNSAASMALCNDKLGSQVVLNSAKIRTPYSVAVAKPEVLDVAIKEMEAAGKLKFPMIIKTMRGTHGIGVMKVDSQGSLTSVAQAMLAFKQDIMLQEFIEHKQSARIIMIGNELLAANLRGQPEDKDEFRTNSHLGSETKKYEPGEEELALARHIVELFGCRFCAIDYIINGDELIVLEVNGSPGLEAIQKDWEGDKNLAAEVVQACASLSGDEHQHNALPPAPQEQHVEQDPEQAKIPAEPVKLAQDQPQEVDGTPEPLKDVEYVSVLRLSAEPIKARIDTGAAYCSLHASDVSCDESWVSFKRGDSTFKVQLNRMIKIRNSHGLTRRPVVRLDIEHRGVRYDGVEFTIVSRETMTHEVLIGRNLLAAMGLPIVVAAPKKAGEEE